MIAAHDFSQIFFAVINLPVGVVRSVNYVNLRYFPVFFAGDDCSVLAGKVEANTSETLQKFIDAIERTSFIIVGNLSLCRIYNRIIDSCNDDFITDRFDDVTVSIQF